MNSSIKFDEHGEEVSFFKEGWNSVAHIDNVPDLVELVKKNKWADNNGYLYCSKLKKYLHRIVVEYKIGKEKLAELTAEGFVVDHLNNDEKYNCRLNNLHIISSDLNIAKGHTVDKDIKELWLKAGIGLYWLKNGLYQIVVGFNVPATISVDKDIKNIERLYWNFENFDKCYNAVQIIISALKDKCNLYADQLQAVTWDYREAIVLSNSYVHSEGPLIKYGDTYVLRINNKSGPNFAVIKKPAPID